MGYGSTSMAKPGSVQARTQLGKLQEAELKIAKLKLALNGRSLTHIRASLQAVAKTAVVHFLRNLPCKKQQNKVQNASLHPIGLKSMHLYL